MCHKWVVKAKDYSVEKNVNTICILDQIYFGFYIFFFFFLIKQMYLIHLFP